MDNFWLEFNSNVCVCRKWYFSTVKWKKWNFDFDSLSYSSLTLAHRSCLKWLMDWDVINGVRNGLLLYRRQSRHISSRCVVCGRVVEELKCRMRRRRVNWSIRARDQRGYTYTLTLQIDVISHIWSPSRNLFYAINYSINIWSMSHLVDESTRSELFQARERRVSIPNAT